jgi:hypothetical protein
MLARHAPGLGRMDRALRDLMASGELESYEVAGESYVMPPACG